MGPVSRRESINGTAAPAGKLQTEPVSRWESINGTAAPAGKLPMEPVSRREPVSHPPAPSAQVEPEDNNMMGRRDNDSPEDTRVEAASSLPSEQSFVLRL